MFNEFNDCWAIYPRALQGMIDSIKAGPVDDAARDGLKIQKRGKTAIVSMRGPMIKSAGSLARYGFSGTRDTAQALIAAANDKDVDSILWIVDSPGGSVAGLDELANTAREVKKEKPIIVQVDGMMASAAVYVTAHASKIYANRRDLVGSIGTRMMLYDFSEMFKNDGVKAIPIDTGDHKSAGAMGTEITESQIVEFHRIVDGYFSDFKNEVLSGRHIDKGTFDGLSDGRLFFADEEPLQFGLIDAIRSINETYLNIDQVHSANARMKMLEI